VKDAASNTPPSIQVAVVVERVAEPNQWQAWAHRVVDVVPDEATFHRASGEALIKLHDDGKVSRWLYPGFTLALHADECKGYFLNLTSGAPAWFVSLRPSDDPRTIDVSAVSVSYIEADRRMAADEAVEVLPLPDELCEWLRVFTNEHFVPDEPRRVRAQSFLTPEQRAALGPAADQGPGQGPRKGRRG
jgi:hypothetical protein